MTHQKATPWKVSGAGMPQQFYFALFILREFFFLFKYIQICTKTSPKPPLLVQY